MKIERSDIINEIDHYNHAFRKNVHVPARMIDEWVREANDDSYWIQNEGLWAWVELRLREI